MIAFGHGPQGITLGKSISHDTLVAMSGVVTAVPLVLFAMAAQRMNYSILGFVQFLAPTLVFFRDSCCSTNRCNRPNWPAFADLAGVGRVQLGHVAPPLIHAKKRGGDQFGPPRFP
jgi:EamA domain-containing membrane protein RarD